MSFERLDEINYNSDPFLEYDPLKQKEVPIIIDNGAYNCRAGFATDQEPSLIFRNLIAKLRGKKEPETLVGNDIGNFETMRFLLRSAFESNELVLDHVFSHLGISASQIEHPIVINEPPANPLASRSNMNELLFECYQVPSVLTGIDALFSHYFNHPDQQTSLILSIGHHSSHILPLINGKLAINYASRINLGGFNLTLYLQRLLQLKYPKHSHQFSFTKCEQIVQNYTRFSTNYKEESLLWANEEYYDKNTIKFNLGNKPTATPVTSTENFSGKCQRIICKVETNLTKKREKTLIDLEEKRKKLKILLELVEDEEMADPSLITRAFQQAGVKNISDLRSKLSELNQEIKLLKSILDPKQESDENVLEEVRDSAKIFHDESKWINHIKNLRQNKLGDDIWILNDLLREYELENKRMKRFGGLQDIIEIGSEIVRIPELLFSPYSLIRYEQGGIGEVMESVMTKLGKPEYSQDIFISGGVALTKGLKERVESDACSCRPFQAPLQVIVAENPLLDAWKGARKLALSNSENFVTKAMYEEHGHDYILEHRASNTWNSILEIE